MIRLFPSARPTTVPLRLSENELSALLYQACRAVFGPKCDSSEISRSVVWLEIHGFDGVDIFLNQRVETPPTLSKYNAQSLDLSGKSLLPIAHVLGDQLLSGVSDFKMVNAGTSTALLPQLERLGRQGIDAAILSENVCLASCSDGQIFIGPVMPAAPAILTLELTQALPITAFMTPAELAARKREALMKGIKVSAENLAKLNEIADKMLVPSTDASRKGAGE